MMNHILVIEDNQADVELIKIYLDEAAFRHKFFHSESFSGGINILGDHHIDLVLLDLSLNDSIGFSTLKNFIREVPDVPVVVMTGNNNEVVGMQSVKAGAQDFLIKGDFDSRRLVKAIRYALQRFKAQSKLQKTAKNLSINEKRYLEAQQMAKFANWEMDIVSNSMKWTDEMYRIFGFQPKSISPSLSDYFEYVHMEDKEKTEAFFDEVVKTGRLNRIEHRIVIDGIMIKHLALQGRVHYDEYTNKILLIGSVQDITEQKKTEGKAPVKPKDNQVTGIKEEAFSALSFNIRTPLSSIVNLLFLLEKNQVSNQQLELIEGLKTSVDDLSIVLNNLMNFSLFVTEHVKINQERFNLREFIHNLGRVFQIKSDQAEIQLRIDIDPTVPDQLIGDTQKITQIIYNIVVKTINFSHPNTQLDIRIESKKQGEEKIQLRMLIDYTGRIVPEELFNPLTIGKDELLESYSLEKNIIGKGQLEVAIVSKLINLLNGSFYFGKKGGNEFGFEMELPLMIAQATNKTNLNSPTAPLVVLLVEDHALNQIATKKVLTSWADGVNVEIAANGLEALNKFSNKKYDIILMDLQMPEMNGIDAALKIRENSEVPIIALTANASKQEEEKCRSIGMNDYLSKPFKPEELYAKILQLIQ